MTSSRSLSDNLKADELLERLVCDSVPVVEILDIVLSEGYELQVQKDYIGIPVRNPRVRLPEKNLKSRGEYHITVFGPTEMHELRTRKGWTMQQLKDKFNGLEIEGKPKYVCLGKQEKDDNVVYYVVVRWPELQVFRRNYGFEKSDLHITLGFRQSDIQGVSKDVDTCIGKLRESLSEGVIKKQLNIKVPKEVMDVLREIKEQGGQGIVVGGAVRDAVIGKPVKDIDIEVYGIPAAELFNLLGKYGKVNAVGKSFGVYKVRLGGMEMDFSLPRKERKVGVGHKGFSIDVDHTLSYTDASKRRDFTINTLGYDPITKEVYDPHGGMKDIERGVIKMTDRSAFRDDPLRVLRMAQFASRFGFDVDPETVGHAKAAPELETLPTERNFEEFRKALLRSKRPSVFLQALDHAHVIDRMFPELSDKVVEAGENLDSVAKIKTGSADEDVILMVAAMALPLENFSKASAFIKRLTKEGAIHKRVQNVYEALKAVDKLVVSNDGAVRHWLAKIKPANRNIAKLLIRALAGGKASELLGRMDVLEPSVVPIIQGRHLLDLGMAPSPLVGKIVKELHRLQLDGVFNDFEGGIAKAKELIAKGQTTEREAIIDELIPRLTERDDHPVYEKIKGEIEERFPEGFIEELEDERPDVTPKEWLEEFRGIESVTVHRVPIKDLLDDMTTYISRTPQEVIDLINKNYDLDVKKTDSIPGDRPERYMKYGKMPASTAKPSTLLNDKPVFGIGRIIAAMIRKDRDVRVYDVKASKRQAERVTQRILKEKPNHRWEHPGWLFAEANRDNKVDELIPNLVRK